jgi:hypothetical protein
MKMINYNEVANSIAREMNSKQKVEPNYDLFIKELSSSENYRLDHIRLRITQAESLVALSYFVMGENLLEAREILKNHDFKEWVKNNCSFKIRTAYNMMTAVLILREYPSLMSLDKSLLYYMGTAKFPKKLIQLLANQSVGDLNLSKVDLIALEASYLDGTITEDSTLALELLKKQKNININKRWQFVVLKLLKILKNELINIKDLSEAQERVVGENDIVKGCSKVLEEILSEAIKKSEKFAEEIGIGVPVRKQKIDFIEIVPLDPLAVGEMLKFKEEEAKAHREHRKKCAETPKINKVYKHVIDAPQKMCGLLDGCEETENDKILLEAKPDTTGNESQVVKTTVIEHRLPGSDYFKKPRMDT